MAFDVNAVSERKTNQSRLRRRRNRAGSTDIQEESAGHYYAFLNPGCLRI
jgi:hypothetical protein